MTMHPGVPTAASTCFSSSLFAPKGIGTGALNTIASISQPSSLINPTSTVSAFSVGLGGTASPSSISAAISQNSVRDSSAAVSNISVSSDPLQVEVPGVLVDLLNQIRKHISRSKELFESFPVSCASNSLEVEDQVDEVKRVYVKQLTALSNARRKANQLEVKVERDFRATEQLQRRYREMIKNPQYGRNQAFEYLISCCSDYDAMVEEFRSHLCSIDGALQRCLVPDSMTLHLKEEDFTHHLKLFDKAFKASAAKVYESNQKIEDLKENFLIYLRQEFPYSVNPFQKQITRDGSSVLRGAEAFPSTLTMMRIGEMAKSASPVQVTAAKQVQGFGTSSTMFGSKPFSFTSSQAPTSILKPFSSSQGQSPSLFGNLAPASAASAASTTSASFLFGNTLSSSVSGTLFGGSAIKPFGK